MFSGPVDYAIGGNNPGQIRAADFDCDLDMDLATANKDSGEVSVFANDGGVIGPSLLTTVRDLWALYDWDIRAG